jgi:hypothetical protein
MKFVFSITLALALLASAPALAQDRIDVMTQNQYLGADLTPIITAPPEGFNQAVIDALSEVAANDIATRADLLAKLIANRLPDLVGLQEVFRYECYDLGPVGEMTGCNDPRIANAFPIDVAPGLSVNDHLVLTTQALSELDENYDVAAIVNNLNVTEPLPAPSPPFPPDSVFPFPGLPVDLDDPPNGVPDIAVTILDRDVILARGDISATVVDYSAACPERMSVDGCNYRVVAPTPLDAVPFIQRGWVGVDATIDGKDYRFVNTHLEVQRPDGSVESSAIQAFQAAELIGVLGATTPPNKSLIVVGDINSSSEDPIIPGAWPSPFDQSGLVPPYTQLEYAGYTDAWTVTGDIPGFSCCQASDLSNHSSVLDERIDVIFSLDPEAWLNKAKKKRVLGSKVPDKSAPDGLWPSDHGSVAAQLEFQ